MKEFSEKHIKDLQEADGFVLQNVYGNTVAIYLDSEYPDVTSFLADYIARYGIKDLSRRLGYRNPTEMLKELLEKADNCLFIMTDIETKLMNAFDGISADGYAKKLEEGKWHLGDIVEDGKGHKAMIIQDNYCLYELMNIKNEGAFKVFSYFDVSDTLNKLQDDNPEWHKVVED
ncbi:hypothetical protein [Lactobacillus johnsonii]|uniref:hypothetical protein n=1 Tax=Lactobacillus johnsonii TaxID=33959 RepID=UPI003D087BE4